MHRLRSLLSTLGVLFGVVAVIAMLSIGEGAKRETLEQIEQLGTHCLIVRAAELSEEQQKEALQKGSDGLTLEDGSQIALLLDPIREYGALRKVEAQLTAVALEEGGESIEVLAVTPGYTQIKGLVLAEGRPLSDGDLRHRGQVCLIGSDVATALGSRGRVGETLRIEREPFLIVGLLAPRRWSRGKSNSALMVRNFNKSILLPLGSDQLLVKRLPMRPHAVDELLLQLHHSEAMSRLLPAVVQLLQRRHREVEDYQLVVPTELLAQAVRTQQTFNMVLGGIAALSLLVGAIGIMNIMLATVSERTREIGIRRAVGATRTHIIVQFLGETLLLTLFGALLGVVLGVVVSWCIGVGAGWKTVVTPFSLLLAIGMASAVGLLSGLYPAFKAAYMDPIQALRRE